MHRMLFILLLFLWTTLANAVGLKQHTKLWLNGDIIGPLSQTHPRLQYYVEPRLQLIDDHYVFDEMYLYAGPGYLITPTLGVYAGYAWVLDKTLHGVVLHENRFWQQALWRIHTTPSYTIESRTRLEERNRLYFAPVAIRLREKVGLIIPLIRAPSYAIVMSDEVFLNLNHPTWLITPFFSENRAFIGIAKTVTKSLRIDVGYVNQYVYSTPKQRNSVFYTSFVFRL